MELIKRIHAKTKQDKYITFDDYMDICLYYPDQGYYNNDKISLNPKNSDFITAPEISFLYSKSILNFYMECKKSKNIENIVEFGAGSGEMAFNILKDMDDDEIPKKYYILEKSYYLKKQQKIKINKLKKIKKSIVEWIDKIENIENAFLIANEVLDAIPAKIFTKQNDFLFEKVITLKNNKLSLLDIPCNDFLSKKIKNIENRLGVPFSNNYSSEININYDNWLSDIFKNISNFIFIVIDYGYSESEFYHQERNKGTIQYYKDHKKLASPLNDPGTFDISVSVDFSRVNRIIKANNLELIAYTTQSEFLIHNNILNNSSRITDTIEKQNILKTLLFPSDMGENFKMMIFCDNMNSEFQVSFKDYRHKL